MFKVFKLNKIVAFFTLICVLVVLIFIPASVYDAIFSTYTVSSDNVESTTVYVDETTAAVPIIMYHSIIKGRKSKYIVSPEQFEKDMIYLYNHEFNTVTMEDLINFVHYNKPLPSKPIVITFDDGHYNNIYYCSSVLEKYNMKAVISIVGEFSEDSNRVGDVNPSYSYITWDHLKNLSSCFELQNHSYAMHKISSKRRGAMKKRSESPNEYETVLREDLGKLQDKIYECTGKYPNTFTYPFGAVTRQSISIIKNMGFRASLGCWEGMNKIVREQPDTLFLMKRYLRKNYPSEEKFFGRFSE